MALDSSIFFNIASELSVSRSNLFLLVALGIAIPVTLSVISSIFFRLIRLVVPYPMTPMGFRAQLVYADVTGAKTFVSHKYQVSARPDFIYRLQNGRYLLIELKSAKKVHKSHEVHRATAYFDCVLTK